MWPILYMISAEKENWEEQVIKYLRSTTRQHEQNASINRSQPDQELKEVNRSTLTSVFTLRCYVALFYSIILDKSTMHELFSLKKCNCIWIEKHTICVVWYYLHFSTKFAVSRCFKIHFSKILCTRSINIKRKWWRKMVGIPLYIRPDFKVILVFVCSRRQLSELLLRRLYLSTVKMCGSGSFPPPVLCVDLPSSCNLECFQIFTEER